MNKIETKIILKSAISEFTNLELLVEEMLLTHRISDDIYGNILVSLSEAFNNAIQHGNNNNADKNVIISVIVESQEVTFEIEDQGEGFNYHEIPDPTDNENIEKLSGRGLFMIFALCDHVNFNEKGNKITLSFNLN
jgi:serine/threonine-protein kinase RsbW